MAKEVMTDEISAIRKTFKGLRKARGYTQDDISDEMYRNLLSLNLKMGQVC